MCVQPNHDAFKPVEGVPVLRHVSPEECSVLEYVVHLILYLVDTAAASSAIAVSVEAAQVFHRHGKLESRIRIVTGWSLIARRNRANVTLVHPIPIRFAF